MFDNRSNEAKKNEIESSVSDLTEALKEVQDKRKGLEQEMKERGKDYGEAEKALEKLLEEFQEFEREDTNLKEDMKNTNTRLLQRDFL